MDTADVRHALRRFTFAATPERESALRPERVNPGLVGEPMDLGKVKDGGVDQP